MAEVENQFSGRADNVVQTRDIHGGVHIHQAPRTPLPVPRQLPPDTTHFTGRTPELRALDDLLLGEAGEEARPAVVLSGMAGVGKTALAVHWARRVRERFPDGDLYVDLRGYDAGPPLPAGQVLEGFLRALDVPGEAIPATLEAQAGLYRSILNDRRILVILDNAATPEQVRPLLPGSRSSHVIITSRGSLSGLVIRDGAVGVALDLPFLQDAVELLRRVLGAGCVDAKPGKTAELVRTCGYLPLALRIAAEQIAAHPHRALADLVNELTVEHNRLDVLTPPDDDSTAPRAVFSQSYSRLPPTAARLFRLLGLHTGPDIDGRAAAALAGVTAGVARPAVDALVRGHLLQEVGRDRYRLHDLLRDYAIERATADETAHERDCGVQRFLTWYLYTAEAADRALHPHRPRIPLAPADLPEPPLPFATHGHALTWCEAERPNLLAAIRQAATARHGTVATIAWKLPAALGGFLDLRKYTNDWVTTHELGLTAARDAQDSAGQAYMLLGLGNAHRYRGSLTRAIDCYRQSLSRYRETADRRGEAAALCNLGTAYRYQGQLELAHAYYQRSLSLTRTIDDRYAEAWALNNIGTTHRQVLDFKDALTPLQQALVIRRELGDRHGEAWTLYDLGHTHRGLRRPGQALAYLQQALTAHRELGNQQGEARTLHNIGKMHQDTGDLAAAAESWHMALTLFKNLGDHQAAEVEARLDTLDSPTG